MRGRSLLYASLRAARAKRGRSRFGEPEFYHLDTLVNRDRAATDVGANLGFYTFRLASLASRVIAIEPNSELVRQIRVAAIMTGSRNVSVVEAALGSTSGRRQFAIPIAANGARDFGQGHIAVASESGFPVSVNRLDDLARTQSASDAAFVKIDIEGAELDALRGATCLLTEARPVVMCEVQEEWCQRYGHTTADVFAYLAGYDYVASSLQGSKFVETAAARPESVNYVFFPGSVPKL
jgi:FkbM family methyltransferase